MKIGVSRGVCWHCGQEGALPCFYADERICRACARDPAALAATFRYERRLEFAALWLGRLAFGLFVLGLARIIAHIVVTP